MEASSPLIALSGPIGSGKSTLADGLEHAGRASVIRTRRLLSETPDESDRRTLQRVGEELDLRQGGQWVAQPTLVLRRSTPEDVAVVVDAVRTRDQIRALHRGSGCFFHIHLSADLETLRERYDARRALHPTREVASFEEITADATERAVRRLAEHADKIIDTTQRGIEETRDFAWSVITAAS